MMGAYVRVLPSFSTLDSFNVTLFPFLLVVYYESRKRELKIRLMNEGR